MHTTDRDMTVMEVAAELHLPKQAIYRAIKAGLLPAYALSPNSTRITRADLDRVKASGGLLAQPSRDSA